MPVRPGQCGWRRSNPPSAHSGCRAIPQRDSARRALGLPILDTGPLARKGQQMDRAQHVDMSIEAAKAVPVVATGSAIVGGLSIPDWAALAALLYTLCLLAQMGYRFWLWVMAKRGKRRRRGDA